MSSLAAQLPLRIPGLVCWPAAKNRRFLVRNRRTGETFELGAQEHFLLQRLDGRKSAEEILRGFAEQFGETLSEEDLDEFIQLAEGRGLLQIDDERGVPTELSVLNRLDLPLSSPTARRLLSKRLASRLLKGVSAVLRLPARLMSVLAGYLDMWRLKHLDFVPLPDDVFIVTYPRSGTTWMQMILYQLTTDGSMDFPHIAEYCPWFERSVRSATAFETRPSPRLFKSHLPYRRIPKGICKCIYVARDGKDVAVSYYHLCLKYNGYEGTFDEFYAQFIKGKTAFGCWFKHVKGWWEHRGDANVLFLTYEQLQSDFDETVRLIADFCGWELSPEKLSRVRERSGFEFMKEHEARFDPALETLWEQGIQLKSFLRNGQIGTGIDALSEEQVVRFQEAYVRRLGSLQLPVDWMETY
jgi:hypothetical protein